MGKCNCFLLSYVCVGKQTENSRVLYVRPGLSQSTEWFHRGEMSMQGKTIQNREKKEGKEGGRFPVPFSLSFLSHKNQTGKTRTLENEKFYTNVLSPDLAFVPLWTT